MGTYGEYIQTQEAVAEAERKRERDIIQWRELGYNLVTLRRGPRGTLEYGRTVAMYRKDPTHEDLRRAKDYKRLGMRGGFRYTRPTFVVTWPDRSLLAGATFKTKDARTFKFYRSQRGAEAQFLDKLFTLNPTAGYEAHRRRRMPRI